MSQIQQNHQESTNSVSMFEKVYAKFTLAIYRLRYRFPPLVESMSKAKVESVNKKVESGKWKKVDFSVESDVERGGKKN